MSAILFRRMVLLVAPVCVLAAQPSKDVNATAPLNAHGTVSFETHKGSIRVIAWDRNEVQAEARLVEDGGWFAQTLAHADVDYVANATEFRIASKADWVGAFFGLAGSPPAFHYTVRVPRTARLQIRDHKSEITVEGLAGEIDINTHKGNVRLRGIEGALVLNTHKGDVRAQFARFDERSRIETHKGQIVVEIPRGTGFILRSDLNRKADLSSQFPLARWTAQGSGSSTVNGGGPELLLRSHKGSFELRER